jgi:predicted DNA-binding protein
MSSSPVLALRLDPKTIERLDDEASLRGHTRSSLARHMIKRQLDNTGNTQTVEPERPRAA